MGARQVLLLNAAGVTAYRCSGRKLAPEATFPTDGIGDFMRYAEAHAADVFSLLVDLADETYSADSVPHVRGRSRAALLARMLDRHCHGTPLCAALPLGRSTEGRRDDRYLFAALTHTRTLDLWLQGIDQASVLLHGVYSLPQIAAGLRSRQGGSFLLTSLGRGGLRQTFVLDGHLRFSRLTVLPADRIDRAGAICSAEAATMRRYLCAQRLMDRDAPLQVVVLAHAAQFEDFRQYCPDTEELRFEHLDSDVEATRQGIALPLDDSFSDALFAGLLARRPPRHQFARTEARRRWQFHRLGRALDAVGLAAVAASLVFAALQVPAMLDMREAAARLSARNDEEERRQAGQRAPDALPLRDLMTLGIALDAMERASPGPAPLLHRLGRALDGLPSVELDRLEWRIANEFEQANGPFAVLEIGGRLSPEPGAQGDVDKLADRLRATSIRATVLKRPFAAESTRSLTSTEPSPDETAFVMRVGQAL